MPSKKRKQADREDDQVDGEKKLSKDKEKEKEEEKPKFLHPKSRRAHSMMRAQMRADEKKQLKKKRVKSYHPDSKNKFHIVIVNVYCY